MALILSSGKREFRLDPPWLNSAGFLPATLLTGSRGEALPFGAWVTPAVSHSPRSPAGGDRVIPFSGGVLLHTGHPNPGISAMVRKDRRVWRAAGRPVIFHLLPFDARELKKLAETIESLDEAVAIEVNLGEVSEADIPGWIRSAGLSQLPVIAQLPLGTPVGRAKLAQEAGASAVSLGPPRGTLLGPGGQPVTGRIYGPALFPMALRCVGEWAAELSVPLFGAGGVTTAADRQAMVEAGAAGVCLDTILWTEPELVLA